MRFVRRLRKPLPVRRRHRGSHAPGRRTIRLL